MIRQFLLALALWTFVPSVAFAQWPPLDSAPQVAKIGAKDVAVIVAVQDYLLLPDVDGAVQNANDWETFLRHGLGLTDVTVIVNQEATRESMLKFAKKAAAAAGPESTVWWVFIGHGAPAPSGDDGLLVGMDAQQSVESLQARGLPQRELLAALESGKQRDTVMLVDACFSGRSGSGEALALGVQPVVPVMVAPTLRRNTVVLSAAKATEFAGQLPGVKRPAFSYLVLGALRGWADNGDGDVTADEVLLYAQRQLRNVTGRNQTPQMLGSGGIVLTRSVVETEPRVVETAPQVAAPVAVAACPAGLMKSEDTSGNCCWPGQAWSQSQAKCVGQPTACPPGMSVSASECISGEAPSTAQARPSRKIDWSKDPRATEYREKRLSMHNSYAHATRRQGEKLKGREMYTALGRPDLAKRWKSWSPVRLYVGLGLLAVGSVVGGVGWSAYSSAEEADSMAFLGVVGGATLALSGLVVTVLAPLIPTEPVNYKELEKLVAAHNKGLRDSLGLPGNIDKQLKAQRLSTIQTPTSSAPYAQAPAQRAINLIHFRF